MDYFLKEHRNLEKTYHKIEASVDLYMREAGISDGLYELIRNLDSDNEEIKKISEEINDQYAFLDEKIDRLKTILASFDVSSTKIENANMRLNEIRRLKRKYHRDVKELINYVGDLEDRIDENNNRARILSDLEKEIEDLNLAYEANASELSKARQASALSLSQEVIASTQGLELKYFDFAIDFKQVKDTRVGFDEVNFMICTNKGQDMSALNMSASGGEMSRILLALKAVLNKLIHLDLVVFDEIDTGVSGKAAIAVGDKMAKIAKDTQVLVITHLAQVAAFGDVVYFVYKEDEGEMTRSHIKKLSFDAIIEELALLASGSKSQNAMNTARELIDEAKAYKNGNK